MKKALWNSLAIWCGLAAPALGAIDSGYYDLSINSHWFAEPLVQRSPMGSQTSLYQFSYGLQGQADWQGELSDMPWRVELFGNWDNQDPGRRYWDIREAHLTKIMDRLEFTAGIGREFWGVSESINVVNVINQADLAESFDGKTKLGQPMLKALYVADSVDLSFIYMPVFRERLYPLRPNAGLNVSDDARYEDGKKQGGWAARAKFYTNNSEWAIGAFAGTRRVPLLSVEPSTGTLVPYYIQTQNVLLDAVYVGDVVSPKLELKIGNELDRHFAALNAGIEYRPDWYLENFNDLTLISEYLYDSREDTLENHGQNDLFLGMRSEIGIDGEVKALFSQDLSYASQYLELSVQYRINDYVRLMSKATTILKASIDDASLYPYRNEDFLRASVHVAF